MADNKQTPNQTMQHEQAKGSVSGGMDRQPSQGGFDKDRKSEQGGFDKDRKSEQGGFDKERQEKGAIGGGETRSETGEPGRARNELDENQSRSETTSR